LFSGSRQSMREDELASLRGRPLLPAITFDYCKPAAGRVTESVM
jgi:hypothetical protein